MNLLGKKHRTKAEYWNFSTVSDPINGPVDTYFYVEDIEFTVTNAAAGVISVFTEKPLRFNAQLRDMRDYKGNFIFAPDTILYVGAGEPLIDVWGKTQGFRYSIAPGLGGSGV